MNSITVTNSSGKFLIIKTEANETVSEGTRHLEMGIMHGESAVVFTERTKRISVEVA